MENGDRIIRLRIFASTLISVIAMLSVAVLLGMGFEIPVAFWALAGLAIGGIVGADVVTTYVKGKGGTDGRP